MLRLPRSVLDLDVAERCCLGDHVTARATGEHLVLGLTSDDDSGDWDDEPQGSQSAIIGGRACRR